MKKQVFSTKQGTYVIGISAIVSIAIIITTIVLFTKFQYSNIVEQMGSLIATKTSDVAETIDMTAGYSTNSIQVTSKAIASNMTGNTLNNPSATIKDHINGTPFSAIEYINADGMNYTDAGNPFDASSREYYTHGIQGETGIWVNYHPKYSKEPLLNFYTPIKQNEKIVGVLTGTLGGNTEIKPLLLDNYVGISVVGLVIDENNNIIASTTSFEPGTVLNEATANIDDKSKEQFFNAVNRADNSIVYLGENYDYTICSVASVPSTGWKVIQVLPSDSIKEAIHSLSFLANIAVGVILTVTLVFFLILLIYNRKISRNYVNEAETERDEQLSVLQSVSDVYYSMTLVDLTTDSFVEYSAQGAVKMILNNGGSAAEAMHKVMDATMLKEYKDYAFEFTDLSTLPERLKGKKYMYTELRGHNVGWIRLAFIVIDVGDDALPTKVMVTTQVIEEEKNREEALRYKSNTDEMTGLLNRRSLEERLRAIQDYPDEDDFVFISLDVNGLKIVNDTLGHVAGDELLKGAASCMKRCFNSYGNVYRIGGDEFCAIINANSDMLEKIKLDFEETIAGWQGNIVKSLAVSAGYVTKAENPSLTITEIQKLADERMYQNKEAFYNKKGVDRRGRAAAHTALCNLYTKILKVNLNEDSYSIVNIDEIEQEESKGYAPTISAWLENFGKSGQVHPDDLDNYLEQTTLSFLKEHFKNNNTSLIISYRRKTNETFKPSMMEIIKADDYTDNNQTLFLYVRNIEL